MIAKALTADSPRRLNLRSVSTICGYLLFAEAIIMLIPLCVSLITSDGDWFGFALGSGASAALGAALCAYGGFRAAGRMSRREGYLVTTLAWIVFSIFGMLPFIFGCAHLDVASAYFETISGFTTTGATTIADVEALHKSTLLWRSMTQWIGGLGIVIFMLAVLPSLNQSGSIPLFNAEATGITHDKIHPRIRQTAASLWCVYLVLTLALLILLWAGPMSFFDALCQSMTTLSTGGFSTRNASIGAWNSRYVGWITSIFMILGGVNFMLLYSLIKGKWRLLWSNDVFRTYIAVIALFLIMMIASLLIRGDVSNPGDLVLIPLFQIASTITTTGFSYGPFAEWGSFMFTLIWILMLMGACAGSTTGAIKIDRLLTLGKNIVRQNELTLSPNHVVTVEINGRPVDSAQMSKISAFLVIYLLLLFAGTSAMCCFGFNVADSAFAAASCIGNNGLGYGATGAGYGELPSAVKWIFSALMLIGRLEIFTVLVVFTRRFWR